jgi:hypothetical protein
MREEVAMPQSDEEIFRWHGVLDIDAEARQAMDELAQQLEMSFEEAVEEVLRRRYGYSQEGWPTMIGEKPYEKLPHYSPGISLSTDVTLPTGKTLSLSTYPGFATEIKLRR